MPNIEMTNKRFGKLTVTGLAGHQGKALAWICKCDCGSVRVVAGTGLRAGRNKSCGCSSPKFSSKRLRTKGATTTSTYKSWAGMLYRCSDRSKGKNKRLYFDKGISVCEKWQTFEGFLEDMGERPHNTTIDRIDGRFGYYKENCRWATSVQQGNNTSCNRLLTYQGKTMTVSQWAKERAIKANTIIYRLRRGWSVGKSLNPNALGVRVERKLRRTVSCEICGKDFIPRLSQLRRGKGKFCSQKCNGLFRSIHTLSRAVWEPIFGSEEELLQEVDALLIHSPARP